MYRVWNKEEACWIKENIVILPNGDISTIEPYKNKLNIFQTDLKSENKYIVHFSININDKNNINIYEGDIIKTDFDVIGAICYIPERLGFFLIDFKNYKYYILDAERCKQCEIIGNVMENPELVPHYHDENVE